MKILKENSFQSQSHTKKDKSEKWKKKYNKTSFKREDVRFLACWGVVNNCIDLELLLLDLIPPIC